MAIQHYWCQPHGLPETILLNQGKVQTRKLESRINELTPLGRKINCRSSKDIFYQEIPHQWQQNQNEISAEEFAQDLNLLCNLQNPNHTRTSYTDQKHEDDIYQDLTDEEDLGENEADTEEEHEELPIINHRRKQISLCRHKLQGRTYNQSRCRRQATKCQRGSQRIQGVDDDHEWAQLEQMEKLIERQKQELLNSGAPELDHDDEVWGEPHRTEDDRILEGDDGWNDGDLNYITAIMESFSRIKPMAKPSASNYAFSHQRARMRMWKCDKRRRQNLIKILIKNQ